MRHVLLYKAGQTDPQLKGEIGDYEQWFSRVLGETVSIEIHLAFDKPSYRISGYDGLIVSGSPRSLVESEPWMDDAAGFVRDAAAAGVAVLGVCFGHQLAAHAYGAQVRRNPNGWEAGTHEVELTLDGQHDLLFEHSPPRFSVNQSHRDEIGELSAQVKQLARGDHTETQALAVGEHVRGVQFHPEMNGAIIRRLIEHRRQILSDEAAIRPRCRPVDHLLSNATDTPQAECVLRNFAVHFVKHA